MPIEVKCPICNKKFKVKPSKVKKQKNVFCSYKCKYDYQKGKPTWNKGTKGIYSLFENHKKNISKSIRNNPKVKKTQFKKGFKPKIESIKKRRETIKKTGCLSGNKNGMYGKTKDKNPNWQGGTSYWRKEYYNSIPYKKWRKSVFKRDNYKCQICGETKNNGKILHAHHKKSFAKYPELRLDINNGLTLCNVCHSKVHSKDFQLGEIISIKNKNEKIDMIDIEVKDNNNFFANGILVHNSATPYREDGRTNYIFALTGKPIGLDWNATLKILGKKLHPINIYILKSEQDKIRKTGELLDLNKKTLIFSDSINLGKSISNKFSIPFIYGGTKKRLDVLEENKVNVVSRVMDYGISIKDLKHIIEVDFLFGSRKQQVQRTGRLLHSLSKDSRHDILFTSNEFNKYKKRLFGLMEKGFKLNFFNEVSKDKIKIDESDFKPMQEIKLPEKKKVKEEARIEQQLEITHSKVDYETFLKNETVKDLIKKALEETTQKKCLKGTLALILQKRRATSYEEIRKSLGLASKTDISKVCSTLEKYELIKKVKDGGITKVDFNIEGVNEIVELSQQREKSAKLIDELFKD